MNSRVVADRTALIKSGVIFVLFPLLWLADKWDSTAKLLGYLQEGLKSIGLSEEAAMPLLVAILLAGFAYYLRQAMSQRSRLRIPARFRIDKEQARHLKGREQETQELGQLCERSPLVFLDGESGSGKSALVAAGLLPWCGDSPTRPLAIRCDLSGASGNVSLATMLAKSLFRDAQEQRGTLGWVTPPNAANVFEALDRVEVQLLRKPLVVFDQFDDYQDAHRSEFYKPGNRELLSSIEFLQAHAFWATIAEGVRTDTWHCAFVTRSDQRAGLDLVRFVEPRGYTLSRLPRNSIAPILDELMRQDGDGDVVVENPDKGWHLLREKLLDDLKSGDTDDVLPVQLAMALQGLQELPALTLREYARHGGIAGLARVRIKREIQRVSQFTRTDPLQILDVLVALTDTERDKTRRLTADALTVYLFQRSNGNNAADQDVQKMHEILLALKQRRLLRSGVDSDEASQDDWLLYHDHLAHGILAYQRETDRWRVTLADHAKRYRLSAGWLARWLALLPVTLQVRLLWVRCLSAMRPSRDAPGFRYGEERHYAALSVFKPTALVVVLILSSFGYLQWERVAGDNRAVENLFLSLSGSGRDLTQNERSTTSDIEKRGPNAARKALEKVFHIPAPQDRGKANDVAGQFDVVLDRVVHSAWGIRASPEASSALLFQISPPACISACTINQIILFNSMLASIYLPAENDASQWGQALVTRMSDEKTDHRDVLVLGDALTTLVGKGANEVDVQQWGQVLAKRISDETTSPYVVAALSQALTALVGKGVKAVDVQQAGQALVKHMTNEEMDSNNVARLGNAVAALAGKGVKAVDVQQAGQALVKRMTNEKMDSKDMPALGEALSVLVGKGVKETDAQQWGQALVKRMTNEKMNSENVASLCKAVAALVGKGVKAADVQQAVQALVEYLSGGAKISIRVDKGYTYYNFGYSNYRKVYGYRYDGYSGSLDTTELIEALSVLVGKGVKETDVQQWGQTLVKRMTNEKTDRYFVEALGAALSVLVGKGVKETDVQQWGQALVKRMTNEKTDRDSVGALGAALSVLVGKGVKETDVQQAGQALVQRISDEKRGLYSSFALVKVLSALVGKGVKETDVQQAGQALVKGMTNEKIDSNNVASLGAALSVLVGKGVKETDVQQAGQALVKRISSNEDDGFSATNPLLTAQVLASLVGKGVTEADVQQAGQALVKRMRDEKKSVASLGEALAALVGKGVKEADVQCSQPSAPLS